MLSCAAGRKKNIYVPDYVIFDLETTGISSALDAVIEISAIKVRGGKVVEEFTSLVNPGRHIPSGASAVNGIYDHMVQDSPSFRTVLGEFVEFIQDLPLVGHNIHSFDMKFLYRDAMEYWGQTIGNDYIDTLYMSRQILPQLRHHRLVDLAEYYHLSTAGAHRALADCRMNQKVFELLGKEVRHADAGGLKVCPRCGENLMKRKGRYGEFWGCEGYPVCRYTENC